MHQLGKKIIRLVVNIKAYDFKKATGKSRMISEFEFGTDAGFSIKTAEKNCDHHRDMILKYIKTNFKE